MNTPIYVPMSVSADTEEIGMTASTGAEAVPLSLGYSVNVTVVEPGGLPTGGNTGDVLIKRTNADYDAEWVAPATTAEQDNTRPITSGAVYMEIGNINALLATI